MHRNFIHFNIDEIHDNLLLGEEITHHELLTAVIGLCGEIKVLKKQISYLRDVIISKKVKEEIEGLNYDTE